jgi:hypothetical protein
LKSTFEGDNRVEYRDVEYLSIIEARRRKPFSAQELKFVKHQRYRPEKETCIVFTDREKETIFPKYDLRIDAIERITLSPSLTKPSVKPMKMLIRKIDGCEDLKVFRSTLTDYQELKNLSSE